MVSSKWRDLQLASLIAVNCAIFFNDPDSHGWMLALELLTKGIFAIGGALFIFWTIDAFAKRRSSKDIK